MQDNPLHRNPDRLSDYEVRRRADEARTLMDNPVFKDAIDDVYSRAVGTLLEADVGSLTATTAHATMKAITAIKTQLHKYINDHKMRQKYSKEDEN